MRVTFQQVQQNISKIANREEYTFDFIFELLAAYGRSSSSITKLRSGLSNVSENKNSEVLQRNVVYFKYIVNGNLVAAVDKMKLETLTVRYNPRYLITTDLKRIAAIDTKKNTTLDIKIQDIDRHIDFFYVWTGNEVTNEKTEGVADRRAAEKMAELYTEIEKVNRERLNSKEENFRHYLNVFFSRLLFCYFAEDTKVFSKENDSLFTDSIKDFTQLDGSDLDQFLTTLFESFDEIDKSKYTSPFSKFPYINGGLFSKEQKIKVPKFNAKARKTIIECGSLKWDEINPDIFGSMFQGVVDEEYRSEHQMHYTSVPNIMKTIEPLFLDELREDFDKNYFNPRKLSKLLERIAKIKIFDPACGSGNFLIIAYKELRRLENAIMERILEGKMNIKITSRIKLDNFFGIEIIDFACELARLSLVIAKHQMDMEFEEIFHEIVSFVPLKEAGNIVNENAARVNWSEVCPNKPHYEEEPIFEQTKLIVDEYEQRKLLQDNARKVVWDEIYLIGNPPYEGARKQSVDQKYDMEFVFEEKLNNYKDLDYIAIWFYKGAFYIQNSMAQLAFVSTNSLVQGQQVSLLWPSIFELNEEIGFAHLSFKWANNAKDNAGVIVVVINLRMRTKSPKYLYDNLIRNNVENINAYLAPTSSTTIITSRKSSLFSLPEMKFGSMPNDGGYLILSSDERKHLINKYPNAIKFIKPFIGAEEFIRGHERYCIWITELNKEEALQIVEIKDRVKKVAIKRKKSKRKETNELANIPYRFGEIRYKETNSIFVPEVSSERRDYIPIGYLDKNTIISNKAFAIYDADIYIFGLISSRIHMVWTKAVAGRLKSDINYSTSIVYNNFPVPPINDYDKKEVELSARNILFARENHSEKTLAEMYDPDKMPEDLRNAHHELDIIVDKLYRDKPYENDEERLSDLFALYEKMIKVEEIKNVKRNN